jgi:hypothetical protein
LNRPLVHPLAAAALQTQLAAANAPPNMALMLMFTTRVMEPTCVRSKSLPEDFKANHRRRRHSLEKEYNSVDMSNSKLQFGFTL